MNILAARKIILVVLLTICLVVYTLFIKEDTAPTQNTNQTKIENMDTKNEN